jgi:hypothetical protein
MGILALDLIGQSLQGCHGIWIALLTDTRPCAAAPPSAPAAHGAMAHLILTRSVHVIAPRPRPIEAAGNVVALWPHRSATIQQGVCARRSARREPRFHRRPPSAALSLATICTSSSPSASKALSRSHTAGCPFRPCLSGPDPSAASRRTSPASPRNMGKASPPAWGEGICNGGGSMNSPVSTEG